jgi:predicted transcriptional regulator
MKRTQASIASEMLAKDIAEKAYRARAIQEAKEEARKGAFISEEAVENWIASIGTDNELPLPEPDVFSKSG